MRTRTWEDTSTGTEEAAVVVTGMRTVAIISTEEIRIAVTSSTIRTSTMIDATEVEVVGTGTENEIVEAVIGRTAARATQTIGGASDRIFC